MVPSKAEIVGRTCRACFPAALKAKIEATIPSSHAHYFQPNSPFPQDLIEKAEADLDALAAILEAEGIKVYRLGEGIDWLAEGGYTGAMPREGLISVGKHSH